MRIAVYISLILFFVSCRKVDDPVKYQEDLLMLRINYSDLNFIEGKEFSFEVEEEPISALPIAFEYAPPGDFGYMKFFHDESEELLFHGEIIWAGSGDIIFPTDWTPAASYSGGFFVPIDVPSTDRWEYIDPSGLESEINYEDLWGPISDLNIVSLYMQEENTKIGVYLYTPSVGVGDPDEWSWILFFHKNQGL